MALELGLWATFYKTATPEQDCYGTAARADPTDSSGRGSSKNLKRTVVSTPYTGQAHRQNERPALEFGSEGASVEGNRDMLSSVDREKHTEGRSAAWL
jgi:hypothetical protein